MWNLPRLGIKPMSPASVGRFLSIVPPRKSLRNFKRVVLARKKSSVQFSCVQLFVTPWTAALQASLSVTNSQSPLKLMFEKRWQEYTEELYKKDLHNPDNHDGLITHLNPDILEGKVKWALGSITRTKQVEVMEFQLSYSKSWKMMLWKCCTQYASKFGKLSSGHRTGKGQFSFQSQRKAMPKNAQTTAQLHSFHTLAK